MGQVSADTWVQLTLWFTVLLGLIILASLIVMRLRGNSADSGPSPSELMTDFQDMRERGDLSDADYRKVKSVLGTRIRPRAGDGKEQP
jgi:hypothetical protein